VLWTSLRRTPSRAHASERAEHVPACERYINTFPCDHYVTPPTLHQRGVKLAFLTSLWRKFAEMSALRIGLKIVTRVVIGINYFWKIMELANFGFFLKENFLIIIAITSKNLSIFLAQYTILFNTWQFKENWISLFDYFLFVWAKNLKP